MSMRMSCSACKPAPGAERRFATWLIALAALAAVSALIALRVVKSEDAVAAASGVVNVEVNGDGFSPSSVTLSPGKAVELEFLRTTDETCASSVAFPELGIHESLVLNKPVRVKVPASQRRSLSFQCGVGDHRSAIVIN